MCCHLKTRKRYIMPYSTATLGLLLSSLARMHKRPENEDREGAELWYAYHTLIATQNAKQEVKRQAEMDDFGEKKRNAPVSTSPEMCDKGGSALLE